MIALTLGDITFSDLEVPSRFNPLGGRQAYAVHEFPGGLRTIQIFGAFPKTVKWTGYLTGPNALDRHQQLDRLRATGQMITLRWGRYAWLGVVCDFEGTPGSQWLCPYSISFEPVQDLSGATTVPSDTVTPEAQMNQQVSTLNDSTNPNTQVQPVPPSMQTSVGQLQSDTSQGLLDGNGIVADIPSGDATTIEGDAANVNAAAVPLIAGTDATQASPALDISANATAISNIVQLPAAPQTLLTVINPNLFLLAQQYLGSADLWQDITDLNGLPADPQPTGQFSLQIPAQPQ